MDTSISIMVVDDYRTMSLIVSKLLRQIGFNHVDQVYDGYSAVDRLTQKRYGLVITDWNMQPMSGARLVQTMKAEPRLSGTPVILIAADGSHRDEALLTGADGYLAKPFTAAILKEVIQEVLARRPTLYNAGAA
jgi:two-component system, chemotaxis family, chemotaxis protein CheY